MKAQWNLGLLLWRLFHFHKWSVWMYTSGTLKQLGYDSYSSCIRKHKSGYGCYAYLVNVRALYPNVQSPPIYVYPYQFHSSLYTRLTVAKRVDRV